jgi:hypothetical protein
MFRVVSGLIAYNLNSKYINRIGNKWGSLVGMVTCGLYGCNRL